MNSRSKSCHIAFASRWLLQRNRCVKIFVSIGLFFISHVVGLKHSSDSLYAADASSPVFAAAADASGASGASGASRSTLSNLVTSLQPRLVKIYGAGGMRGLESYQSGILVSPEGHIVTTWSTVLDVNVLRVITSDGRKLDAEMVGMDPQTEIAVLKLPDSNRDCFDLSNSVSANVGDRVLGLSNLFGIATGDEALSVQRGIVMANAPLVASRGRMKTLYQGRVLVLDVMTNNPGATGGAIVDLKGHLVGMMGKELRDDQSNIWLNYALPIEVVADSVKRILDGTASAKSATKKSIVSKPHQLTGLGFALIPDVLPKTPPYVDHIVSRSIADRCGLQPNDLILVLNKNRIDSRRTLEESLKDIDRADNFEMLVQRGQELVRIEIRP